jgi:Spy/CpxP family protein refolding chaperone
MEKMKSLHENKSLDMMKKREEAKALMEKRKETMKSILTDEQRKKIQEMKKYYPRKPGKLS